ncbi:hypothetical protein Tco_0199705 [Tanacetum coccineum]
MFRPLAIHHLKFSTWKSVDYAKISNDLFTYEVEVGNIPCNLKVDNDSEDEVDDDVGYDLSDIRGDDEVELTDEESSNNEDEIDEVFRIDTNIFDYETPICSAFKEFNYLLNVDPDLLTKDIEGFKTYKDYKDDWIYEWNKDDYEWYEALEDSKLKDLALRNKASMEGLIDDDDNESCYEQRIRWNVSTNYDDTYELNHEGNEREELSETHELTVCNIRRFKMTGYSFGQNKEYVAIKEDVYEDLIRTSNNACRAYQEIFCKMDEGWTVTRAE